MVKSDIQTGLCCYYFITWQALTPVVKRYHFTFNPRQPTTPTSPTVDGAAIWLVWCRRKYFIFVFCVVDFVSKEFKDSPSDLQLIENVENYI
jgi:hypothetical protein